MKPEQIYKELINLAEKLDITVKEENLRKAGIHVNSGLCKIKGRDFFIMDKHKKLKEKIEILSECLSEQKHETVFVVPAIRELLNTPLPTSDELHEKG
ncbi:MAG: hypothetical protein FP816_04610 [Desulfobacteraceae bacterium]|nr:hypothetical protein [Desulfobacteraceae bacterium]MBU4001417.1 hypothetical protein [Pseudomonadota bacterium]